jgi:hypothetical protein
VNEDIAQKIVEALKKMSESACAELVGDVQTDSAEFNYAYGVTMAYDRAVLILLNEGIVL